MAEAETYAALEQVIRDAAERANAAAATGGDMPRVGTAKDHLSNAQDCANIIKTLRESEHPNF